MENTQKICGIICQRARKSIVGELHELFGETEFRQIEIDAQDSVALTELLRSKQFDALHVELPYRLKVMPQLSKCSPEARLCGADIILKADNGKLYGHNTEVYGFSYLLDRAGIDVFEKSCVILGKGSPAAAVLAGLKERKVGKAIIITKEKINEIPKDTAIIIATSAAEDISLEGFENLLYVIDLRYDQPNSKLLQDAVSRGIPAIDGYAMAAAAVKLSRELMTGAEIPDSELSCVIRKIKTQRTNVILLGNDQTKKLELGTALAEKLGRRHYDLNKIIEQLNGKSIDRIIRENGKAELLRIEHVAAEWAGKQAGTVITIGASVAERDDNRAALKKNSVLVFFPSENEENEDMLSEKCREWCDIELKRSQTLDESIAEIEKILEG